MGIGCSDADKTVKKEGVSPAAEVDPAKKEEAPAAEAAATPAAKEDAPASASGINYEALSKQDSTTSTAIIEVFSGDEKFIEVAKIETAQILKRDEEDGQQLTKGINVAIEKGVIPAEVEVEPVTKIDVMGKTADVVAQEIIDKLGEAANNGCVMTLEGLSGTGKGTTVERLKGKLPKATTWSNGNIFRSLTLLSVTHAEQNGIELADALTAENLDSFVKMLTFGKFNDKFDVKIEGLGHSCLVSEVQNTTLKTAAVGKNIPTVAGVTQGEVITFVKGALDQMAADGITVLLEGRAQTLNYIRTPHRFELILGDELLIGKRRAAQKMMAAAIKDVTEKSTEQEIQAALSTALASILEEASK